MLLAVYSDFFAFCTQNTLFVSTGYGKLTRGKGPGTDATRLALFRFTDGMRSWFT